MVNQQIRLLPRSPLAGCLSVEVAGSNIIFSDRSGLGMATVLERKGQGAALAERVREHFGIDLPSGPRRVASGSLAFAGIGVGKWLGSAESDSDAFVCQLRAELGDLASVVDQADGYAVLRMTGPKVRQLLGKLVPIDVHPRAFQIGDVAVTVSAHIGVTLWRLPDRGDGAPVFEVAAPRSMARSLWHGVATAAAEFGYAVEPLECAAMLPV
jgi:heterotetrameric sarcosine oxidase gamma subunit